MIKKTLIAFALIPINFVAAGELLFREYYITVNQWQQITSHHGILTTNHYVARQIFSINPPPPPFSDTHNEYFDNKRPSNRTIALEEKKTHFTPKIISKLLGFFVKMSRSPESISAFLEDLKTRHINLPNFKAWDEALESIVLNNDDSTIADHMKNFEYLPTVNKDCLSKKAFALLERKSTSMNPQQDTKTRFLGLFSGDTTLGKFLSIPSSTEGFN